MQPRPTPTVPARTPAPPTVVTQSSSGTRIATASARNEVGRILVIPTQEMDGLEIASVREDISIMSRILDKAIAPEIIETSIYEDTTDSQTLINMIRTGEPIAPRQNLTEGMYIAGFGAVFSMRVNFPLRRPSNGPEPKDSIADSNNVWEQTRREIVTPAAARGIVQEARIRQQRPPYDARRVEELKNKLIESIKHASNIRALKSDDWIIISVTGPGIRQVRAPEPQSGIYGGVGRGGYGGPLPGREQNMQQGLDGQGNIPAPAQLGQPDTVMPAGFNSDDFEFFIQRYGTAPSSGTTSLPRRAPNLMPTGLVIKAKKSDIDIFAKGKISLQSFKERLELIPYW